VSDGFAARTKRCGPDGSRLVNNFIRESLFVISQTRPKAWRPASNSGFAKRSNGDIPHYFARQVKYRWTNRNNEECPHYSDQAYMRPHEVPVSRGDVFTAGLRHNPRNPCRLSDELPATPYTSGSVERSTRVYGTAVGLTSIFYSRAINRRVRVPLLVVLHSCTSR
jgi:hypothetical protein